MSGPTKSRFTIEQSIAPGKGQPMDVEYSRLANATYGLQQMLLEEQARSRFLVEAFHDSLERLAKACAFRDHEIAEHIDRLGHYARVIAQHLGWSGEDLEMIGKAAPMHDLGKIAIPDCILLKAGPLTPEEWRIMETHTIVGAKLLDNSKSPLMQMARQIALTHHERWDGTGYPYKLKGEQIPTCGRIVMFADQYDALRSKRSYKPAYSHDRVREILLEGDGRTMPCHFDPVMLEAFARNHETFEEIFSAHKVLSNAS